MTEKSPAEILEKFVQPRSTIVIGVSGGPDSMYLLETCVKFSKKADVKIVVAHINHGLRGQESNDDEQFVKKFCAKKNIQFECLSLKKLPKGNLEEVCRIARYKYFDELKKKYRAQWILTAHQQNDLVETVLFNLIRGTYLDGLKGMEIADKSNFLLRPLLEITRDQILSYLKKNKIRFRTDSSNKSGKMSRNLIRNKIIPLLKKINPQFQKSMLKNVKGVHDLRNALAHRQKKFKSENKKNIYLDNFLNEPESIQKNIIADLYKKTHGNTIKFNNEHLDQIIRVLAKRQSGLKKEFGDHHLITVKRHQQSKKHLIQVLKKTA